MLLQERVFAIWSQHTRLVHAVQRLRDTTKRSSSIVQYLNSRINMADMDIDMDMGDDPELARLQAEAEAIVRMLTRSMQSATDLLTRRMAPRHPRTR